MLTDQMKELLTAFVDGELSQRQRKAVMRLLHKSSKARELVRELQENAHKVKKLPRRKCEPSLVDEVMEAIVQPQPQPQPPAKPKFARRRWLPYVSAGLAASIMIGSAGGLLYWSSLPTDPSNKGGAGTIAENKTGVPIIPKKEPKIEKKTPDPTPPRKPSNTDSALAKNDKKAPDPAPIIEPKAFTAMFSELRAEEQGVGRQLARELKPNQVTQLDITVKNNVQAMDHLRATLKSRGVTVVTDPAAATSLMAKNQAKVEYLVYAENLTANEVARLMSELAQEIVISQGNKEKKIDSPYKQVVVAPIAKDDKQKLAKLLGVESNAIEPKDGKDAKPDPKRQASALLLPTTGGASPSPQVRQFVNERQPQPGTMHVLIKIRQE